MAKLQEFQLVCMCVPEYVLCTLKIGSKVLVDVCPFENFIELRKATVVTLIFICVGQARKISDKTWILMFRLELRNALQIP